MATRKKRAAEPQQEASTAQDGPQPIDAALNEVVERAEGYAAKVRRKDPFGSQGVRWADGYKIVYQESDSRNTAEIQFGDGTTASQPKNLPEIRQYLTAEGMEWNGTNAWVMNLKPTRGSMGQRHEAQQANRETRAYVEDVIFPAVIELEEKLRGPCLSEQIKVQAERSR